MRRSFNSYLVEMAPIRPSRQLSTLGELKDVLPLRLFEHISIVYHRLERIADTHGRSIAPLRLAVLLHEEPPHSLSNVLAAAGLSDFAATTLGVIGGFGELWKTTSDADIATYVNAHRDYLASLLLFELAHEGCTTLAMERAAEIGGLAQSFKHWAARM